MTAIKSALLFGLLTLSNLTFAQPNPCLCIDSESTPCSSAGTRANNIYPMNGVRSVLLKVVSDPPPATNALNNFPGARYKAFWMFGDGNMAYYPHQSYEQDLNSLTQPYTYSQNGLYKVEALLTEKKSNTLPPARTIRDVRVQNASPGTGTPFYERITNEDDKTADILPSDSMRPHNYLTAFAVSAPKDPENTGIYFFYNSKIGGAGIDAAHVHDLEGLVLPHYNTTTGLTEQLTANLNNSMGQLLRRTYQNYVFVPIEPAQLANMPNGFDEYRIFPILKTIWTDSLRTCRFLAVVVGGSPASVDQFRREVEVKGQTPSDITTGGFFTQNKYDALQALVEGIFKGNLNLNTAILDANSQDSSFYIRGMYYTEVPMIGSSDPNELEVLSICPLSDGKYRVKMRMQVCNRGTLPELTVPIRLIDHTGGQFSDFKFVQDSAKLSPSLQYEAATHTWKFIWPDGIQGVWEPTDVTDANRALVKPYEPQCVEVFFELTASYNGVRDLVRGEALEGCAHFPAAAALRIPDVCEMNFPVNGFCKKCGYACGECRCDDPIFCCGLVFFLLIGVFLAVLIWWFLKRND